MNHEPVSFTTDITVRASAAKVWDLLTVSSFIWQYLGIRVESDWHKGSDITYYSEIEGKPSINKAFILEIEPLRLLKQRYLPNWSSLEDVSENYQIITTSLVERDAHVIVTVLIENIRDDFFKQRAPEIWGELLTALKEITER